LKRNLSQLRNEGGEPDTRNWRGFVEEYIDSLHQFFKSLRAIIKRASKHVRYFRLFNILGPAATLYPLITKLEVLGLLDTKLTGKKYEQYTFLDLIELIDVRVYKTKGTDPRADISRFACQVNSSWSAKRVQDWLANYNQSKMPKETFQSYLKAMYMETERCLTFLLISVNIFRREDMPSMSL